MPVLRIEKIEAGIVVKRTEPNKRDRKYRCFYDGLNKRPVLFATLDEVADFLRKNYGSGVRMKPGNGVIRNDIFIDGVAR